MIKKVGCCSQCGTKLFNPNEKVWDGLRCEFKLRDGTIMDLTICEGCLNILDLEALWDNVLESWQAAGAPVDYVDGQQKHNGLEMLRTAVPWEVVKKLEQTYNG